MSNKFIVIVPVYNSVQWIEECIDSIMTQTYKNFELIVVDDCSTDGTYDAINRAHTKYENKFTICRNHHRLGTPLANNIKAIELFSHDKEDIIVTVDGDDKLSSNAVLAYLNNIYENPNVYMTYGTFVPMSHSYPAFGKPIKNTQAYRKSGAWIASHLRTFKNKLWRQLKDEDLRDAEGNYFTVANDAAYMFPLIEMCGQKHLRYIKTVLYKYNDLNPMNDMKVQKEEQMATDRYIRSKPCYNELTELL